MTSGAAFFVFAKGPVKPVWEVGKQLSDLPREASRFLFYLRSNNILSKMHPGSLVHAPNSLPYYPNKQHIKLYVLRVVCL